MCAYNMIYLFLLYTILKVHVRFDDKASKQRI